MKLLAFLKGKKTYIIGIVTVALGFLQNDMQMVMTGLGMLALRNAIPSQ